MRDTILAAIINRSVLTVTCGEFVRIIHPYLLYEASDGHEVLHGWQVDGETHTPPNKWLYLRMDAITAVIPHPECFEDTHHQYNPTSVRFHRVIIATPKEYR